MKKTWLSAVLNFFLMGAGYIYNGKRILIGVLLTIAAIGLTYVEQFYIFSDGNSLQAHDSKAFFIMAACIFVLNTGLAIDAFNEAKQINLENQ